MIIKLLIIGLWILLGYTAVIFSKGKKSEVYGYLLGSIFLVAAPFMLLLA